MPLVMTVRRSVQQALPAHTLVQRSHMWLLPAVTARVARGGLCSCLGSGFLKWSTAASCVHILWLHCVGAPCAECRELGCVSAEVLAELRYNLPATMRFHK